MNMDEYNIKFGVDKTVIGLPYPNMHKTDINLLSETDTKALLHKQKEFVASKMQFKKMIEHSKENVKITKNKFLTRYLIKAEDETIACEVYLGKFGSTHVINVQFNPNKITKFGKAEMYGLLSVCLDYDYSELYDRGSVSHLELFVDVLDVDMNDYQLIDLGRRKITPQGTTRYNGRRNSKLTMVSYDKAGQLKTNDSKWRFEVRIRDTSMLIKEFILSPPKNPFSSFVLIKKGNLQSIAQEIGIQHLGQKINDLGFYGAVKNKAARDKIALRIRAAKADFWDIDYFWKRLVGELNQLNPNQFFSLN